MLGHRWNNRVTSSFKDVHVKCICNGFEMFTLIRLFYCMPKSYRFIAFFILFSLSNDGSTFQSISMSEKKLLTIFFLLKSKFETTKQIDRF